MLLWAIDNMLLHGLMEERGIILGHGVAHHDFAA